jgi:Flp pilus assembly pilin Flp
MRRLTGDRRAAAPLEYALIASMVGVVLAVALTSVHMNFGAVHAALGAMVSAFR